jgi:DNA ligase-1
MAVITKPLLAVSAEDVNKLTYPRLASPKLDGIRCLVMDQQVLSRKFKLIPNAHIRSKLAWLGNYGRELDGELIVGKTFQDSSSGVMTEAGTPAFTYNVFDFINGSLDEPFEKRYERLVKFVEEVKKADPTHPITLVEHRIVASVDELMQYEQECLDAGYEGVMLRDVAGKYKCGRSTLREGILLKVKRFTDIEGEVVGFEERMHNANEATEDELGHTKRSSHQENMIPTGTLGSLLLRLPDGMTFSCGTGFDDATRQHIWDNRDKYMGKLAKVKYQEAGVKDRPRFPVFEGWRDERDM